jgi:hypothetical protein
MNNRLIFKVAGIAATACLSACEPVPHNAISDACTILDKAEESGGQIWAPAQLTKGRALYDSAMKELSLEKRKLPFNRRYDKTIELLDVAAEAGHYALESVDAANSRMRSEARELLDRANRLADSVDNVLRAAADRRNITHLHAAIDSARMAREEALAALDRSDMFLAEDLATSADNKTREVARRIGTALSHPGKHSGRE